MSCLAPAPLADIATKADVRDLAAKIDALVEQRDTDRKETAAQRDTHRKETAALITAKFDALVALREVDRKEAAAQREADHKETAAAQREADLRTSRHRHYWTYGHHDDTDRREHDGATGLAAECALAGCRRIPNLEFCEPKNRRSEACASYESCLYRHLANCRAGCRSW